MSSVITFKPGERWSYRGVTFSFERELGDGLLLFQNERTLAPLQIETEGGRGAPDVRWAVAAYAAGDLKRAPAVKGSSARRVAAAREYDSTTIRKMDPDARLRLFVLRGMDELGLTSLSVKAVAAALDRLWATSSDALTTSAPPPARTVLRWLQARGEAGARPMAQMVSMTGRVPRRGRLPEEVRALMKRGALRYWSQRELDIKDAYALMAMRVMRLSRWRERAGLGGFTIPSRETFRQQVLALECRETVAAKFGSKRAANRYKAVEGGLSAPRILSLGLMDATSFDAIAALDATWMLPIGTPWLVVVMDVKSRCIVGFFLSFEPPSTLGVMECLKRACTPKMYYDGQDGATGGLVNVFGRFNEIVVDNGKEFAGLAFEDAFADAGMTVRLAPVASPQHKAMVERFFGTLNSLLNHKLPGARLPVPVMRELGYDPQASQLLTVEEIEELIWEALRLYHLDEHSGIKAPPALVWARDVEAFGIPVHDDLQQFDKMMGAVREGRRLSRSGIELHTLQYHDPVVVSALLSELAPQDPQRDQRRSGSATAKVKVKFNPADLGEIHVWHHIRRRYVTLPCTEPQYARGLSLWHHNTLNAWARQAGLAFSSQAERLKARADLIAKIERLAPDAKIRQRRALARLWKSPAIQDRLHGVVELQYAPARHDGLAPIVPQIALASERRDGGAISSRPARAGKPKKAPPQAPRAKPVTQEAKFEPASSQPSSQWKTFE
ncbi:MAG: hypothetical protein EON91_01535 [Brevundimonas sp.]|uniref:Mu transposase C-terminal domain-containing protein n=1 Tax=Brevundimonas sp. TaxID=1871086 RepID=UPI00120DE7BD|nr:Mu transposase C-terminal domain-containing protein [Brevundimonas sp.]RZJ19395.1 MAG: hypothetical protein EON91_01535 [Brevundimonas sp.]